MVGDPKNTSPEGETSAYTAGYTVRDTLGTRVKREELKELSRQKPS